MILSVIIVNWNVKSFLERCLNSLISTNLPRILSHEFEVFVVDNGSKDGSAEMVREKFPQVKLIENKENLGFSRANNQAIRQAEGEFILLLNPDTEILNNALEKMVDFMKRYSDCGIAGCKLLNPKTGIKLGESSILSKEQKKNQNAQKFDKEKFEIQPSVRRFPTLLSQIITLTKAPNIFPWLVKKYVGLDIDYNSSQQGPGGCPKGLRSYPARGYPAGLEVDQVMGAFFMIRKKVIEQIGLLDENFWAWFEEVDYCKRTKKAGWKIYYTPEAEIIHHKGQSFSQLTKRQRQFNKSLLYYFKKHHSFFAWLILWLMQPLSLFLTFVDEKIGIKRRIGKKKYL